jgi:hypothetical protein
MRYCFVLIRGEMNKVMIIEKQRFGRGLIREISKYVCTLYAYYSWRCSNTFYAYYYLSYEVNRICSAIYYTNKKNRLKLTESIFYTLSICFLIHSNYLDHLQVLWKLMSQHSCWKIVASILISSISIYLDAYTLHLQSNLFHH